MINSDVNTIVTIHNYWYARTYIYVYKKQTKVDCTVAFPHVLLHREEDAIWKGGGGRGGAEGCGGGVNLFKQQNHWWRVKKTKSQGKEHRLKEEQGDKAQLSRGDEAGVGEWGGGSCAKNKM